MNKARALLVPAVTIAMELSACAEAPKPEPEYPVIMVDIGPAGSGVLEESGQQTELTREPLVYEKKPAPDLTIERIMRQVPKESISLINRQIEALRQVQVSDQINGAGIVGKCETSDEAVACMKIRWVENSRVRSENPKDFEQCDYIMNDEDQWFSCITMRVMADPQALGVMKYCRAEVRDCVRDEFRKVRE